MQAINDSVWEGNNETNADLWRSEPSVPGIKSRIQDGRVWQTPRSFTYRHYVREHLDGCLQCPSRIREEGLEVKEYWRQQLSEGE